MDISSFNRRRFLQMSAIGLGAISAETGAARWLVTPTDAAGGANTDFLAGKWGVFTHFFGADGSNGNNVVDSFDVNLFADQLASVGANHYIITLGQNSGYYCSPNATYDSYVGYSPSHCSTRDLVADLYPALQVRGITLMVYLPAGAPDQDPQAMSALEWTIGPNRNAAFQEKWQNVIREWSNRWGAKVAGWWFDGCYWPDAMYNFANTPNWNSYAAATRAGNPNSAIAFNPGVQNPIQAVCPQEDYTAGETNDVSSVSCPGRFITASANASGGANPQVQWHMLSYMGSGWGEGTPRYSNSDFINYTRNILNQGGCVTWDVPLNPNFSGTSLNQQCLDQLTALKQALSVGNGQGSFSTSFEGGDPQPTWTNTVDAVQPGGGIGNSAGICCGLTTPEAGTRNETAHTGSTALMYSGSATNPGGANYAYMKLFDLTAKNITVGSSTTLSYWIYPQSQSTSNIVSGANSTSVAIDLIFQDNSGNLSNLRDSGAVDQNGNKAHPAYQYNKLTLDSWNQVTVNLGAHSTGLKIVRLDLGYDQPNGSGGYRGYIDDISIHS